MAYGLAFGIVLGLWLVTAALFAVYVSLVHGHIRNVEQTILESHQVADVPQQLHTVESFAEVNPPVVGLIVEPRNHVNLLPVLANFRRILPQVPLYVLHSAQNRDVLHAAYAHDPAVRLVDMGVDNLTIRQYNCIMTMPNLWANLRGEHILVFQTDSVLFSQSRVHLEDYLQYDYVGAPWKFLYKFYFRNAFMFRGLDDHTWAGNGGLSLRRRALMQEICANQPYLSIPYMNEDVYFSNAMDHWPNVKLPSSRDAARLFFESVYADELPLGCHKYLPTRFISQIADDERAIIENYSQPKSQ